MLEAIALHPEASLREIAREARVSLGTAHNVRARLAANLDPLHTTAGTAGRVGQDGNRPQGPQLAVGRRSEERCDVDWSVIRHVLQRDPALKYSESGRVLLQWLNMHAIDAEECEQLADAVPPHWAEVVARVALNCAEEWRKFAAKLQ